MAHVHTLDDLGSRERLDAGAAKPARLAVLGHPVAHSASPAMHQAALDARGIGARYVAVDVEPGQVAAAFARMRALEFIGCNVTVPHKLEAHAACSELDPVAADLGAVNTVLFTPVATHGCNTDGPGFVQAIREEFQVDLRDLRVLVLGAGGGAGQAIAGQCVREGCERLVLANRTLAKLAPLAARWKPRFHTDRLEGPRDRLRVVGMDDPALGEAAGESDLIVNCSSVGMRGGDGSPIPVSYIGPWHLVYDTVYQPARTALLRGAALAGARVANGRSLLLHQGVLAFELWFPGEAPVARMRAGLAGSAG